MKFIPRSSATWTAPDRLVQVDAAELLPERRCAEAQPGELQARLPQLAIFHRIDPQRIVWFDARHGDRPPTGQLRPRHEDFPERLDRPPRRLVGVGVRAAPRPRHSRS